ncbi:MAG: hypothetical protein XD75_0582 [Parcubacteria bacterium 33_209]|nr:MAG: hypothetical protein XD75_0582 [Parcubacteria bacterium 33_209]
MAIPNKATGAGNNNAANVFKVTFSQALSTAPKYEAWDNSKTFPAKDESGSTVAKEIFTGTTGNGNKPMLYLVDTNAGATPPGANWKPASATTHGLRYVNTGTSWAAGPYKLTLPESGTVDAGEVGVTT